MSEEKILVFDENGNSTDTLVPRSQIHDTELWHQVIHVWVVDEKGEILLQKRSANKKLYANVWHVSVAGHISAYDDPLDTAVRETNEEIGLPFTEKDFIFVHRTEVVQAVPETGFEDREWICVYLLKVNSSTLKIKLQQEEVVQVRWISLNEFETDIIDPKKSKMYLNHPQSYYLSTIGKIRENL